MVLPSKKVPPPPKQPGTHTNAEVKEALHARALRRTIIITAVVILLLAALAVVSSTAQEYQGINDAEHYPKAVVIVVNGLTGYAWDRGLRSNKAPFTRLLSNFGGIYTILNATYTNDAALSEENRTMANLVRLLTGSTADNVKHTLAGATSFLRSLKAKFKPVIVAPASYWSSNQMDNDDTTCTRVGFFDAECTNTECPMTNKEAYCNAYRKYVACDNETALYTDDIITAFNNTLKSNADLLYVQLDRFFDEGDSEATVGGTLQKRSAINLLDGTIGRIAMALAERTKAKEENWLIIVTSGGTEQEASAPMLMAAYSDGHVVQLKRPDTGRELKTTDIRGTLFKWFGVDSDSYDQSRVIGLCSGGAAVANCNSSNSTAAAS